MRKCMTPAIMLAILLAANTMAQSNKGRFGAGPFIGGIKMLGGQNDFSTIGGWFGLTGEYGITDRATVSLEAAFGWVRAKNDTTPSFNSSNSLPFKTNLLPVMAHFNYYLNNRNKFQPFVSVGAGLTTVDVRALGTGSSFGFAGTKLARKISPTLSLAGGADYMVGRTLALSGALRLRQLLGINFDTSGLGYTIDANGNVVPLDANNMVAEFQIGLKKHFGGGGAPRLPQEEEFPFFSEDDPFGEDSTSQFGAADIVETSAFTSTPMAAASMKGRFGVSPFLGGIKMLGGQNDLSTIGGWFGLMGEYGITDRATVSVEAALGWVRAKNDTTPAFNSSRSLPFKTVLLPIMAHLNYYLSTRGKFQPFVSAGVGVTNIDVRALNTGSNFGFGGTRIASKVSPTLSLAGGADLKVSQSLALTGALRLRQLLGINFDTSGLGYTVDANGNVVPLDANNLVAEFQFGVKKFFGGTSAGPADEPLFADEFAPIDETGAEEDESATSDDIAELLGLDNNQNSGGGSSQMQEYVRLKSRVDELQQEIDFKEGEIRSLQTSISEKERRIGELQGQGFTVDASAGASRSTSTTTAAASQPISTSSFSLAYEGGVSLLRNKQYSEASAIFANLIKEFPSHALTSNCHYWRGEALFGLGQYQAAADAFGKVLEFSLSLKKDDALLMLGRTYVQLNRKEDARRAFNRLIQEHPSSEFVMKAEELLNNI